MATTTNAQLTIYIPTAQFIFLKRFVLYTEILSTKASAPFLTGLFNGFSERWTQHNCLHVYTHRHWLSHMHQKIYLKHQATGAFVVFGVYIWFTSENKCHCRSKRVISFIRFCLIFQASLNVRIQSKISSYLYCCVISVSDSKYGYNRYACKYISASLLISKQLWVQTVGLA